MEFTYLKKVMNGRSFKVFHWHVVTWIHFIVSDYPLERPPRIAFVQHQVRRLLRRLRRMGSTWSFSWRGRISLDGRNGLDGHHVDNWFVQVYRLGGKLGNSWRRIFGRFWLLRTSTTGKVVKVHRARDSFPFPCLGRRFLDGRGGGVLDLDVLITTGDSLLFIFLHSSYSYNKENKLRVKKKKEEKEERSGRHLLRRVVSSCTRFSEVGIGPSPQAARRLKVTRPWKDLSEKERTWSIRSK